LIFIDLLIGVVVGSQCININYINHSIINLLSSGDNLSIKSLVIDFAGILLVYFLPEISGLLNSPFYLFEPMRVIVIVSLVHSSKKNSYLLALLLPLISFLFSNHPSIAKTFILSGDLLLNIFLFFFFKKSYNTFLSMAFSITLSKLAYYFAKYLMIHFSVIQGDLISTPIYIQVILIISLSGYSYLAGKLTMKK